MAKVPSSSTHFDCIVVGAGMSGLTFAALAAQSGKRVLIVEQHVVPGGCFTSFRRGGFLFNVALEWMTDCGRGQACWRLLERLGLAGAYTFHRLETFKTLHLPDAPGVALRCGRADCEAALVEAFPAEHKGIRRFLDDCVAVSMGTPVGRHVLLTVGMKPVEAMLASYVDDLRLRYVLGSVLGYPNAVGVLLMYIIGAACLQQLFVPDDGDHRRLPVMLHRAITAAGGTVRYGCTVDEILVDGREARGIRTTDGETYLAPRVVAAIDRHELYQRLLRGTEPDERHTQRRIGASCYSQFIGLRRPVAALAGHYAHMLLGDEPQWRKDPRDPQHAPMRVDLQSLVYPSLAPAGKATIGMWLSAPPLGPTTASDWTVDAAEAAASREAGARTGAIMSARVARAFGIAADDIEVLSLASPITFHRYTRNTGGSVTGYCLTENRYLARPSTVTPIGNLHHIGHWTTQSGVGVVMREAHRLFTQVWPAAPALSAVGT